MPENEAALDEQDAIPTIKMRKGQLNETSNTVLTKSRPLSPSDFSPNTLPKFIANPNQQPQKIKRPETDLSVYT